MRSISSDKKKTKGPPRRRSPSPTQRGVRRRRKSRSTDNKPAARTPSRRSPPSRRRSPRKRARAPRENDDDHDHDDSDKQRKRLPSGTTATECSECSDDRRTRTFPCRLENTVFRTAAEYAAYERLLKAQPAGAYDVDQRHRVAERATALVRTESTDAAADPRRRRSVRFPCVDAVRSIDSPY